MSDIARKVLITVITILVTTALIVSVSLTWESGANQRRRREIEQGATIDDDEMTSPMSMPAIVSPPISEAGDVTLPDNIEVIGVVVGDQQRCYTLDALRGIGEEVVNDVIDGTAITVILYRARMNFVRVLGGGKPKGRPYGIHSEAWMKGKLWVADGAYRFAVDGDAIRIPDWPFVRTTWKQWRTQYPQTKVYASSPIFLNAAVEQDRLDRRYSVGPPQTWATFQLDVRSEEASQGRLKFKQPDEWSVQGSQAEGWRLLPGKELKTTIDVRVFAQVMPQSPSLETYFKDAEQWAGQQLGEKVVVSRSDMVQIGDFPARCLQFRFEAYEKPRQALVYRIWADSIDCRILCQGPADEMDLWRPVLQQIVRSLTVN